MTPAPPVRAPRQRTLDWGRASATLWGYGQRVAHRVPDLQLDLLVVYRDHARAELDADRLAIDDTRHHVVSVLGQLDVSIVGSAPAMMALALNPTMTARPTPDYTLRPATYAFDTLTQRSLDAADVLVLQDVSMSDPGAMGRVRNHLLQGKPVPERYQVLGVPIMWILRVILYSVTISLIKSETFQS